MSRASLRRQMFHKNLDRLLTETTLQPVQEEHQYNRTEDAESVTDIDYINEELVDLPHTRHPATGEGRSPIYRPKPDWKTASKKDFGPSLRPFSEYENLNHTYAEPWSPSIATPEPCQEPAVDKPHYKKKTQTVQPLRFQFPDLNNNDLCLSPIHNSTPVSSHPAGQSRAGSRGVKALPMSPALFLTQSTSTPGPREEDFQDPRCKSIREHRDDRPCSIFSFPECNMCRICHEDGSREKLISPCHCAGTMGMLHMSCLEKWLGSSNTTKCEICQFQFKVLKKRHPIKWYMQEPSLHEERRAMVKDVSLTLCVSLLVIVISILCLAFAGKLLGEDKKAPSVILILLATVTVVAYCVWIIVVGRRMHSRFTLWNKNHHMVQIRQSDKPDTSNKIFRRFSLDLVRKLKSQPSETVNRDLQSSTYISYSLESYKAAMFNPVTPTQPLLDNIHDITSLDMNSPSVMSLDEEESQETTVLYYQPPENGQTSVLFSDQGKLLRETGV